MYSYATKHHFFTSNYSEMAGLKAQTNIWVVETPNGMGYVSAAPGPGLTPLFRFLNTVTGDYYDTVNEVEAIEANNLEQGVECYVSVLTDKDKGPFSVPISNVYGFYMLLTKDHCFTLTPGEYLPSVPKTCNDNRCTWSVFKL